MELAGHYENVLDIVGLMRSTRVPKTS